MKIVIDARVIQKKMHGIARYTHNLINNLLKLDRENSYVVICSEDVSTELFEDRKNLSIVKCSLKPYSLAEQFFLPGFIKKLKPDIYHSPTFAAPIFQPCPVIMTIHDMIHLTHPSELSLIHRLYYELIVKRAAKKACGVITVSKFSGIEISRLLAIPKEKIHITYNGIDLNLFSPLKKDEPLTWKFNGHKNGYFLFVGNEKPHKNVKKLIEVYGRMFKKNNFLPPLFLVGVSKEFLDSQFNSGLTENIVTLTPKSDGELVKIYQNASLFIAPSEVEGFGLTVLEAMACGVPVISSNIPALKEVVGDEGLFFNPSDSNEMEDTILNAYTDKKLREHLVANGLTRASEFTWEATAQKTLALYKTLL